MRVRTEARRDHILEVAARVFLELGFERASMAEIAAQVGGSKATLYGYFPSKEQLFLAVTEAAGREHFETAFTELQAAPDDVAAALRRFGERFLAFVSSAPALAAHRMVIAEAGHSDIGRRFFANGPERGEGVVAAYVESAMAAGRLRRADSRIAAMQFFALLGAELLPRCMFGVEVPPSRRQINQVVERAVEVFMAAYERPANAAPEKASAGAETVVSAARTRR